jgi:hypothetical protein
LDNKFAGALANPSQPEIPITISPTIKTLNRVRAE